MTRKRASATTGQTPRPSKRQRAKAPRRNVNQEEDSSDDDGRPKHILLEDEKQEEEYEEEGGTYVDDIYIPPKLTQVAHAGVGERLVIEKIVCENFKSYAGVKEMGPFHKNFTAIVGPNGNGKSNIIDAMLFVFGYKSAKIRCKKVSVLIHNSDLLPHVSSCSVTVHFGKIYDSGVSSGGDADALNILPNSRISVTRRATASGSSEYLLENKKVKFQEVATFLKANGIDIIHNRFLILQGEVESIAQMPPKASSNGLEGGLMEYLEDIVGTRRYLKCLIKLEDKIKILDFDREAKLHQVDLVEQEKRAMAEPVKKAKEYLRDFNSKIRVEHQLLQLTNRDALKDLQQLDEKKVEIETSLKTILDRLAEIKSSNDEKAKEFQKAEKEYHQLESDYKKNKKTLNTAEAEYTKIHEQLLRANDQRKKTIKEISKNEKELEKLDEIPIGHDETMKTLQNRLNELNEQCASEETKVESLLAKLQKRIDGIINEKNEADKNLMKLKSVLNEKKTTAENAKSDLNVYKQQEESERVKFETYTKELEETKEKVKAKEKEARSSMNNTNPVVLEEKLTQKKIERDGLAVNEKTKNEELTKLQSTYQESKDSLEGSAINDQTYKAFLSEKKKGRLEGLYGRLKDLATIEERYNVAASVSSGMWDFWICDNDNTAEQCIRTLKDKGLLYQNFLCLNKLDRYAHSMNAKFNCPNRAKRIFDLLKFTKPEVAPAFYKALTNTLVAENLQIGSEIAYGPTRFRVATINGDLIDAHGSMSGGGQKKPQGKLNSGMAEHLAHSVTGEELERQAALLNKCRKEFDEISSKRESLDQEIRAIAKDIDQRKMKLATFDVDIQSLKSQIPLKEARVKQQEAKLKSCTVDTKILKEKEKTLKAAEKQLEEITEPCERAEEEANKMKSKLEQLQIVEKKEIKKNLNTYTEQKKKVEAEITKQTVNMKNYEKNRAKTEATIKSLTKQREDLQSQMEKYSETRTEIEGNAKSIKEVVDKLEVEMNESKEKVKKLKDASNLFRDEENTLGKEKVSVETKLANIMNTHKGIQHSIKRSEEKLTNLKLREILEETVEPLKIYTPEELDSFKLKDLQHKLERKAQKLQGRQPNLAILDAYQDKIDQFLREVEGLDQVTSHRDKIRDAYIKAETQRLSEFMEGYAIISSKLKEMFRMISMGGDAELDLLNKTDPFLEGVELCVRPANKAWKPIKHLSGGEKTLASLALVFALHHFKPSPFYIMDEIDAALDFKNVSIIANYIKDRTKFTQFIIISLRSNMFELADTLLGVYKVDNMSYSMHMGVGGLMKKLKLIYEKNGKAFPITSGQVAAAPVNSNKEVEIRVRGEEGDENEKSEVERAAAGENEVLSSSSNSYSEKKRQNPSGSPSRVSQQNESQIEVSAAVL